MYETDSGCMQEAEFDPRVYETIQQVHEVVAMRFEAMLTSRLNSFDMQNTCSPQPAILYTD